VCWQIKHTSGAWALVSVLGTPQRTRGAWAAPGVSHACAPLGDT